MTAPDVELEPPQGISADTTCDESEEHEPEVSWQEVKQQLRLESIRLQHVLKLFESQYEIASPVDAFSHIKDFLGIYMVSSFDLAAFRESLGSDPVAVGKSLDEAYMKKVASDLAAGPECMLRLAMTVARAYGLRMEDWEDVNEACSEALRIVPACYHLKNQLPAALDRARTMRFLADDNTTSPAPAEGKEKNEDAPAESEADKTNPWKSLEGQLRFDEAHCLKWNAVELLTAHDQAVTQCFAGAFMVENVAEVEETGVVLVTLEALRLSAPPCGFPEKDIMAGETIFWEAEKGLAPVLLQGVVIEGDWYETQNEMCFLGAVNTVAPRWILT